MYTFKTELFGLTVEVEGTFEAEEKQTHTDPGSPAEFIIEDIQHKGDSFDIESLPEEEADRLIQEAFAAKESDMRNAE